MSELINKKRKAEYSPAFLNLVSTFVICNIKDLRFCVGKIRCLIRNFVDVDIDFCTAQ